MSAPSPSAWPRRLGRFGLDPRFDDSGECIDSDAGNLYARLEPTAPGLPIFFCAHVDTVVPTAPIDPVVEDGIVRNAAGTILGADNKAAVAVMLEGVRRVVEEERPHAGIELVFTTREETGCQGAGAFDASVLDARCGFVYDHQAPIGEVVVAAPFQRTIDVVFRGRAAHAGFNPEDGRSAIQAAARAIADIELGRLDDRTTANVGRIEGGTARNVVPDRCEVVAEARSLDEGRLLEVVQTMVDAFAFAASVTDCDVETNLTESTAAIASRPRTRPSLSRTRRWSARLRTPRGVLVGGGAAESPSTRVAYRASSCRMEWPTSTARTSTSRSPTSTPWWTSRSRSSSALAA